MHELLIITVLAQILPLKMLYEIFGKVFQFLIVLATLKNRGKNVQKKLSLELLPKLVVDPRKTQPLYKKTVQSIVDIARAVGGEGFEDVEEEKILDMVLPGSEVLSVAEVEVNQQIETEEGTQ